MGYYTYDKGKTYRVKSDQGNFTAKASSLDAARKIAAKRVVKVHGHILDIEEA